jgi:putative addiction module component (TIGR02574 family)
MGATLRELGIDRLSVIERMRLVEEIWDSIAADPDSLEIPQSHKDELDRRLDEHELHPEAAASREDVMARLLKKPRDTR